MCVAPSVNYTFENYKSGRWLIQFGWLKFSKINTNGAFFDDVYLSMIELSIN